MERVRSSTLAAEGAALLLPLDVKVAGMAVSAKCRASARRVLRKVRRAGREGGSARREMSAEEAAWSSRRGWVGSSSGDRACSRTRLPSEGGDFAVEAAVAIAG